MKKLARIPRGWSSKKLWYSARIVMQAVHTQERVREKLFEDSIILIRAASDEEARRRAEKVGRSREHAYLNMYGKRVEWVFFKLLDLVEVLEDPPRDGSEVYYRFLNKKELDRLLTGLRVKKRRPS